MHGCTVAHIREGERERDLERRKRQEEEGRREEGRGERGIGNGGKALALHKDATMVVHTVRFLINGVTTRTPVI